MTQRITTTLAASDIDEGGGGGPRHRSQAGRQPALTCLHPRCARTPRRVPPRCQCGGFVGARTAQCRRCGRVLRGAGQYRQLVLDL